MSRVIDQQWFPKDEEARARRLRDQLAPAAAKKGYTVGVTREPGSSPNRGWFVTVVDPKG